jgi:hypothetical protein
MKVRKEKYFADTYARVRLHSLNLPQTLDFIQDVLAGELAGTCAVNASSFLTARAGGWKSGLSTNRWVLLEQKGDLISR